MGADAIYANDFQLFSLQNFLDGEGKAVLWSLIEYLAAGAEVRGPEAAAQISVAALL